MGAHRGSRTKVKINRYFILLLLISFLLGHLAETLLIFSFVTLHEICHVLLAHYFGLNVLEIELFPFGGVATIDNLDSVVQMEEIMVSAAGPLFNIGTAYAVFFLFAAGVYIPYYKLIMDVNISLAVFNLLPGLPLDGGRILRAVFSYYVGFRKATKTAVICGKIIAILLLMLGTWAALNGRINITLIVMPFFIFSSASRQEDILMYTVMRDVVSKNTHIKSSGSMDSVQICAYQSTSIKDVLRHFELNRYHIIVVINDMMEIECVITESQMMKAAESLRPDATLGSVCAALKG